MEEDSTMREKKLTYKNLVGKGLILWADFETFHCLLHSVPPAGFTWTIKSPKIPCVGLLLVFINLCWWLQVGHHPVRRSGVPAQPSSHSLSYQCPNRHTQPFTHYFLLAPFPMSEAAPYFPIKADYVFLTFIMRFHSVVKLSRTKDTV